MPVKGIGKTAQNLGGEGVKLGLGQGHKGFDLLRHDVFHHGPQRGLIHSGPHGGHFAKQRQGAKVGKCPVQDNHFAQAVGGGIGHLDRAPSCAAKRGLKAGLDGGISMTNRWKSSAVVGKGRGGQVLLPRPPQPLRSGGLWRSGQPKRYKTRSRGRSSPDTLPPPPSLGHGAAQGRAADLRCFRVTRSAGSASPCRPDGPRRASVSPGGAPVWPESWRAGCRWPLVLQHRQSPPLSWRTKPPRSRGCGHRPAQAANRHRRTVPAVRWPQGGCGFGPHHLRRCRARH